MCCVYVSEWIGMTTAMMTSLLCAFLCAASRGDNCEATQGVKKVRRDSAFHCLRDFMF